MQKVKDVYLFVATDNEGNEKVMGTIEGESAMPLITTDSAHLKDLHSIAAQVSYELDMPYEVKHFTYVRV
jgi:hypothetical protein